MSKFEKLCKEYRENKRMIEELGEMNEKLKSAIIEIMGTRDTVVEGATKASYILVNTNRFDSTSFKAVYPGLYKQYVKCNTCYRFTVV